MNPPTQITLSGIVNPRKQPFAGVGDVATHPGAGRTPYIDATIFDGKAWRALDLKGFGFGAGGRVFTSSSEIGPLMRQIAQKINSCKGLPVYYECPFGQDRRKYLFRGVPISTFPQHPY
ncbi:hypothetical protein NVV81_04830 [Pseudomonas carnis]|uniref:hypothetical protein n=1 Tax=Pseudomonas carnis TaxID=2487355 RepID=UPI0021C8F51C|nr:hypothetical protein [Pseudomonas carnis]MCR8661684.1 hypothetical protein [Pseudomonas carnis]